MTVVTGQCGRCHTPIEQGDLRCAICGQATPVEQATAQEETVVEVLRCEVCDAAVAYDAAAQAPRCAFCDSVMKLERVEDPMEQTELYVPFTVEREAARGALRKWLGTLGWFRPPDLKSTARVESLRPLYWVGWVFDATAFVSWACDSNEGARRSSWAPHSGQTELVFDDIAVSASRGLTDAETGFLAPSYDLATATPEPGPRAPEGVVIEQFDVQRSVARRRILNGIYGTAAERLKQRHIPGSRFRKLKMVALLRGLHTRRYAVPAWVMAYRYKDKLYRAVVSGQDVAYIQGKAPYSAARIALVVVLGLLGLGVAALVVGLAAS